MATATTAQPTPAMRQFHRFKEQHPDCVLFFRMGDFYEMFYDDAKLANKVLGVTLTQRSAGIPMAGVPHHSVEGYLRRMIQAGHRVAVCEQMESPVQAKGVVRREVTRVITPGTLTDEALLEEGRENPLAVVTVDGHGQASIAWAELSTGAFAFTTLGIQELCDELSRIAPSEILYPESFEGEALAGLMGAARSIGCVTAKRPAWQFRPIEAAEVLCKQFEVAALEGFGLSRGDPALGAAAAAVHYLLETQSPTVSTGGVARLAHLQPPRRLERTSHMVIDQASLRSLEVEQTIRGGTTDGTLLGVLQGCVTAMGKRALRQWLCYPLRDIKAIHDRHRAVGAMVEDSSLIRKLRDALDRVQDVQRITARIAVGRATPRDLVGLGGSAAQASALAQSLDGRPAFAPQHDRLTAVANQLSELADTIAIACDDSPPAHMREGGLIRDGYDAQLDEYRALQHDSHTWLATYQKGLAEQSGISSLKVGFNKVFGYYIEVTSANKDRAPDQWSRKQTLKNAERYTTPQLKEYEGKVLSAQQRAIAREQELFAQLCAQAQNQIPNLRAFADTVAQLDVLACFAKQAITQRYVQPVMTDEPMLDIRGGRHPVLDRSLADRFVPNDTCLGCGGADDDTKSQETHGQTLALITGPNMAGKSTYIRQTALITLMAHAGSFVPAESAMIGLCDRVFTRVGASDELHSGQSTFMVEMVEAANICHHATEASLVILDEIGRGTSTLDGLSLAWAIAEHLAGRRCRTLFATHYHELTQLAEAHANVTNLHVTVREWDDQVVFLHRIVPGATDRSYGIHVAKIAGLPASVVDRASQLLGQLSVSHTQPTASLSTPPDPPPGGQLGLFTQYLEHPAVDKLRGVDLDTLTPIQAFDLLRQLSQETRQQG